MYYKMETPTKKEEELTKLASTEETDKKNVDCILSQIEAEGVIKVQELLKTTKNVLPINDTVFGNNLIKIMADGCQEFMNKTGRTGLTYSELRQMYG